MHPHRAAVLWRICSHLFLASFLMGHAFAQPQDNCLKLAKVVTDYEALRQGGELEVNLHFRTSDCMVAVQNDIEDHRKLVDVRTDPGLRVRVEGVDSLGIVRIGKTDPVIYGARVRTLYLRIVADADLPIGIRRPSILLAYETIDQTGHRIPCLIELEVPVNVVSHDAPVKQQRENRRWGVADTLLLPFRIIQALLSGTGS